MLSCTNHDIPTIQQLNLSPGLKNLRHLLMCQQRHTFRWRFQVANHVHCRASGTVAVTKELAVACTGSVDCPNSSGLLMKLITESP